MKTDFDKVNEWLIQLFHDFMILEEQFLKDSAYSDVTVKELQILTLVHTLGTCRATDIAKNQKLALSTITITLNRLEDKGYIERKRSTADRRVTHIILTSKGDELCATHREFSIRLQIIYLIAFMELLKINWLVNLQPYTILWRI